MLLSFLFILAVKQRLKIAKKRGGDSKQQIRNRLRDQRDLKII